MDPLLIAFCFLALAVALILIDLIVPSAGILLVLAIISGIAADIFAFRSSTQFGLWMLIGELAAIPIGLWIFAKFWASTPMGKRMIIEPPKPIPFDWEIGQTVGKFGTAIDDFLPTGRIEIDGKLFDAVGRAGPIKEGQRVLVVAAEMGQLFVVPDTTHEAFPVAEKLDFDNSPTSVDSVNQPAKNFGLQSLE